MKITGVNVEGNWPANTCNDDPYDVLANEIVSGYQKNGIDVDGAGSQATIIAATVKGAGTTNVIDHNGIQVSVGLSPKSSSPRSPKTNTKAKRRPPG